jgi:hypothetical protein
MTLEHDELILEAARKSLRTRAVNTNGSAKTRQAGDATTLSSYLQIGNPRLPCNLFQLVQY